MSQSEYLQGYDVVKHTIDTIEEFMRIQKDLVNPVPLGPAYATMPPHAVDNHLRLYRLEKNWCKPDATFAKQRKASSIATMLAYDTEGARFNNDISFTHVYYERLFECARMNLSRNLARHYRFKPGRVRIPSGETFKGAKGDVSLLAKLRDVEQLCVTADCFDLAAQVLFEVPGFKRAVKAHFLEYTLEENKRLYESFVGPKSEVAFYCFKSKLLEIVTIVDGMKLSTVPKDNNVDRVIAMEPFLNMLVQSVIEEGIRHVILTCYGIDLETSQELHKLLIRDLNNATIDLRNASNSVFLGPVKRFLAHTALLEDVLSARSPIAIGAESNHVLNMVAPMGNGFTFGLMTLILLCLSRELDSFSHVYGDDIVIDKDVAYDLIHLLQSIGFETNTKKTFIEGSFRESCGAFWSLDHEVASYEFHYPQTILDCFVLCNKVYLLQEKTRDPVWIELHNKLLKGIPPVFLGAKFATDDIETRFVWCAESKLRIKRKDRMCKAIWRAETARHAAFLNEIQVDPRAVVVVVHVSYKEDEYRNIPLYNIHDKHWISYYLYTGRRTAPVRRKKEVEKPLSFDVKLIPNWSGNPFVFNANT